MPAYTCLGGWCTDKNVERKILPVVGCRMRPNTYTLINLSLVFPSLLFFLCRKESVSVWIGFIVFVVLNRMLDIVDGGVARSCNMKSKTGAILDIFTDLSLAVGIFVIVLVFWLRSKNSSVAGLIVLLLTGASVVSHFAQLVKEARESERGREMNVIDTVVADNSFIVSLFIMVLVKYVIERMRAE